MNSRLLNLSTILVAVVTVGVGVFIYNSAQSVVPDALDTITIQEVEAFNRNSSELNSLLKQSKMDYEKELRESLNGYKKVSECGGTYVVDVFWNPVTEDEKRFCARDYDYSDCSRDID